MTDLATRTSPDDLGVGGAPRSAAAGLGCPAANEIEELVLEPGEGLDVEERLIVAPAVGIFRPLENCSEGSAPVECGQAIGVVESVGAEPRTVHSPHKGRLQGLLAHRGERVRAGQPVAWLRALA